MQHIIRLDGQKVVAAGTHGAWPLVQGSQAPTPQPPRLQEAAVSIMRGRTIIGALYLRSAGKLGGACACAREEGEDSV